MAHFAELDKNSVVLRVIVVANDMLLENGQESEAKGIAFCKQLFGQDTNWIQTSYNRTFRKNYAAIGSVYDPQKVAFVGHKPFESWELDEDTCQWVAPTPYPTDGQFYQWNESTRCWVADN